MKGQKVKELFKKSWVKAGSIVLATALVFTGSMWMEQQTQTTVPELVSFVDMEGTIQIEEEEVPLGTPKVTTTTNTTKKTKKVKMKKAATKTYSKKGKTRTKTTTSKASNSEATTETKTVTKTSTLNKYKKGSKINTKVTTVKTTVTKTVTEKATTSASADTKTAAAASAASGQVTDTSVTSLASRVDGRVSGAYNKLGFKIVVNSNVSYSGLFDARTRTITLKKADDTIYHELGHFLAFIAGNADTSASFQQVFAKEKSKYTAYNKAYVLSSSSEYFAESFKNYTLDPAALKASRPETYAAIQAALATVTDAQVNKILSVYGSVWS